MRKTFIIMAMVVALAMGTMVTATAQGQSTDGNAANSLGKTTLDTTVAADDPNEMNYGDGIPNGEWVTAESQGIVLGLRATDRTDGLLDVTGTAGNRVGVYEASTGFDTGTTNRSEWNYEWSVDLSGATGNAAGKGVTDYSLALEQNFAPDLGTFALPMPDVCYGDATLCQQSWNPMFFGAADNGYSPSASETYNLRLILSPETFNGPPLAVEIQVNVSAN